MNRTKQKSQITAVIHPSNKSENTEQKYVRYHLNVMLIFLTQIFHWNRYKQFCIQVIKFGLDWCSHLLFYNIKLDIFHFHWVNEETYDCIHGFYTWQSVLPCVKLNKLTKIFGLEKDWRQQCCQISYITDSEPSCIIIIGDHSCTVGDDDDDDFLCL